MLTPYKKYLKDKNILLASSSPRRKEILNNLGLTFTVKKSTFEENLDKGSYPDPSDYVLQTALCKTKVVVEDMVLNNEPLADIVIGADTVVYIGGEILEKPLDKTDAEEMLRKLSGRVHKVCTGVVLLFKRLHNDDITTTEPCDKNYEITCFNDVTEVEFDVLCDDVIKNYVKTGEPMDKAGAFGIQGLGGSLIKGIKGDYFNVMGLPANHLCRRMAEKIKQRCADN